MHSAFSCEAPNAIPLGNKLQLHYGNLLIEQFLEALLDLEQERIIWPLGEKLATITQGFEHGISGLEYNLSNVVGVIDGSHIPIHPPYKNGARFVNRKNFVVDYSEHFIYVHIDEADYKRLIYKEQRFNKVLSSMRMIIEQVFGNILDEKENNDDFINENNEVDKEIVADNERENMVRRQKREYLANILANLY
ncbi:putative nuclease harbi1 [Gigaspora margarita]|uniref:Putative nuclease harbi1 n=1 Tax=Gigaspora margarita TaxID=4874 RepID=A0A8H4AEL4_GIGMA|nr:putative nuclease harbi1 [Gigaspora margarita]